MKTKLYRVFFSPNRDKMRESIRVILFILCQARRISKLYWFRLIDSNELECIDCMLFRCDTKFCNYSEMRQSFIGLTFETQRKQCIRCRTHTLNSSEWTQRIAWEKLPPWTPSCNNTVNVTFHEHKWELLLHFVPSLFVLSREASKKIILLCDSNHPVAHNLITREKKLFCECWAESKRQNNYTYQTEHSHFQNGIKSGSLDVSVADRRHQQNAGVIPTKHVKNKKPVESDLNKYAQTMPIVSVNYRIMVVSFVIFWFSRFFYPVAKRKYAIFIE